jgi:FkbM family methyltransferase
MNKNDIKNLINRPNPTIFEIGCADGNDTEEFIDIFSDNFKIYCFEPDPRNAKTFLNKNSLKRDNVIFENKAISNTNDIVKFNQSSTIYSSSLKSPTLKLNQIWPDIKFNNTVEIESITLDKYTKNHCINFIDFIWADVQGAEDLMIEGGAETFRNKVKFLYTEYAKEEIYHNAPNQNMIKKLLGENWEIMYDFGTDVLLINKSLI